MSMRVVVDNERVTVALTGERRGSRRRCSPLDHALMPRRATCCRARLDELSVRAPRFVSSSNGVRPRWSAAPSWRRCRRRSPRCGRWSSSGDARRRGPGVRMVEDLARRARREGSIASVRSPTMPASSCGCGFSIVPHTWVPEKIAHDCFACPLFRICGQQALVSIASTSTEREPSRTARRTAGCEASCLTCSRSRAASPPRPGFAPAGCTAGSRRTASRTCR